MLNDELVKGMTTGKRLELFINANFRSNTEFAEAIGVNPVMVSRWINGLRLPGGENLAKFKTAGCSIDWLLTGEGEMNLKKVN